MRRALIVAGGSMDAAFGRNYIEKTRFDLTIAADAGMQFFYDTGGKPDWIIGDFDSVNGETLQYYKAKEDIGLIRLVPEKDDTDTEAAVRLAMKEGCGEIHILGATGSRVDHMLGNIGLLGIGLEEGVDIILADPQNRVRMIKDRLTLSRCGQYGNYVSLLPVTAEVTGVTLLGMKYPLRDFTMRRYRSLGISNEITEDTAEIILKEGVLLVIEALDSFTAANKKQ